MKFNDLRGYGGMFRQPIQNPSKDKTAMFALMDDDKKIEMDLIMLTPGGFYHALKYIKEMNPQRVRLFVPTLREEYISDIFNLYNSLKSFIPVKWVFPVKSDHASFRDGQIISTSYTNEVDTKLSIRYVENKYIDGVYDIEVINKDGTHFFSQHLEEDDLESLLQSDAVNFIHLQASISTYGGITYSEAIKNKRKNQYKLIPYAFSSVEEYYYLVYGELLGNIVDFI